MTSAESPEGVIHRFASLLDTAGVPYMLTGSFASGFHGAPRATQDIDIVISPTLGSLNRFLRLLPEDKYYVSRDAALDAYSRELLFNVLKVVLYGYYRGFTSSRRIAEACFRNGRVAPEDCSSGAPTDPYLPN